MKVYLYKENELGHQAIIVPGRHAHTHSKTVFERDKGLYRELLAEAIEAIDLAERAPWPTV